MEPDLEKNLEKQGASFSEKAATDENDHIMNKNEQETINEKSVANAASVEVVSEKSPEIDPNYVKFGYLKGFSLFFLYLLLQYLIEVYFTHDRKQIKSMLRGIKTLIKQDSEDKSLLIETLIEVRRRMKQTIAQALCVGVVFAHLSVFLFFCAKRVCKYHKAVLAVEKYNVYSNLSVFMSLFLLFFSVQTVLGPANYCYEVSISVREASSMLAEAIA